MSNRSLSRQAIEAAGYQLQPDGSYAKPPHLQPKIIGSGELFGVQVDYVLNGRTEAGKPKKKRKQPVSSCCRAEMRVSSSDEGTSCHICANCGKPCDAAPPKKSPLSAKFEAQWAALKGPPLLPEHRFHKTRKWRFDFACPRAMIGIELDGGIFNGGRHTRASGFKGDCEKMNAAATDGWRIFRLATGMVTTAAVQQIIDAIRNSEP